MHTYLIDWVILSSLALHWKDYSSLKEISIILPLLTNLLSKCLLSTPVVNLTSSKEK